MKRSGKNMKLNKEDFLVFRAIQYNTERAIQQYKTEQYEAIYIYKYRYKCTIQRGAAMEGSCIPVHTYVVYVYLYIMYSCIERASMTRGVSQGRVDPSSLTLEVPISLVLQYCNVGLLTFL